MVNGMPVGIAPGSSRNKSKMSAALSTYEKDVKEVYISVYVKKKVVDGKEIVVGCINREGKREEYTKPEGFKKAVMDQIDGVMGALQK